MPKEVLDERSVTLEEVQELLKENEKRGELSYIQRVTLDYAIKFSQLTLENAKKLVDELRAEFNFDLDTAIQIANCLPASLSELRTFMVGTKENALGQEELVKILEKINKTASR
ncbi:MAG: RNA polymerase Rpb4 family protein [Promethearchaeati archaeon SRVP18_Atabeyarchaeia-1]